MKSGVPTTTSEKPMATQFPGSLRDYFAAAAMQGELACQAPEFYEYFPTGVASNSCEYLAKQSYAIADAMLKARENKDRQQDTANGPADAG